MIIKISHDGLINCPPGRAFKKEYVNYIFGQLPKREVRISLAAFPNNPPHVGTLITFSLAFSLAQRLEKLGKSVTVVLGLVDTETSFSTDKFILEDIEYQKSLASAGKFNNYLADFEELLNKLSSYYGNLNYEIVKMSSLSLHPKVPEIISKIINEKEKIESLLFPETRGLGLRSACSQCGLADRYGVNNCYEDTSISFFCPQHDRYSIDIQKDGLQKLEFETPLRNLIRGLLYTEDNQERDVPYSWLRITGSDHAGFYQEQTFYKGAALLGADIANSPLIVYTPLVVDWTGAKLSKSILIEGGYKCLIDQGLEYFFNWQRFREKFGDEGLRKLFKEVDLWLEEPSKLFRSYTIFYFIELFKEEKVITSDIQLEEETWISLQEAQVEVFPKYDI
ncbi:hypothetical protein RhiirA1_518262 [Rhizophagus irregularis]|uniref:Methionyl/Leucyl tRNA synthetase domain-containing protein n=1 Tax=Rhizophagus irregularis TaxID=588596 RepID=A0A2I1EA46_9GLOM|nr:hypothetical protein RhiirA1_518262 [Rhizophagus irregularis]PKY18973.1 hypothetical protein RhiirB3_493145 [Rhizophagus irregularis]CAB4480447.1 unnamed protein product [Rhizophagus irregularis]CAB5332198.1 unnamed protein product [Rhizophagus irregularis]